jgi:hypothetical protein
VKERQGYGESEKLRDKWIAISKRQKGVDTHREIDIDRSRATERQPDTEGGGGRIKR